jgi:hypothetical protein
LIHKDRYKLAEMSVKEKKIYAGSACIGLFHRIKHDIVEGYKVKVLELMGAKALMDAVTKFEFPEGVPEAEARLRELLKGKP